jgi:hypothetical protein
MLLNEVKAVRKNNKHVKGKYPKQPVIPIRDPREQKAFFQATDAQAPLGPHQLAAGYIQHPDTGFWQVWISTNGLDITQVAAFQQPAKAAGAIEILQKEAKNGSLANPSLVTGLFKFFEQESDGQARPLPDDLVRKLVRDILHHVIWSQDQENESPHDSE